MAKKTGLGKGLDALFSENNVVKVPIEKKDNIEKEIKEKIVKKDNVTEIKEGEELVRSIDINEIEPNKSQPRKTFKNESLEELSISIKEYGIIQPIIVIKKDNYYEIVAGERRWRASKLVGMTHMPCIVRKIEEKENKEIALIENIQREDLNPVDKARALKNLLDNYEMTQQQLSDKIGMSRSAIANTCRLLNLDERVLKLAEDGMITEGHCRSLIAIDDGDKQYAAALIIIEKGESVRDIERKVKNKKKAQKVDSKYNAIFRDIEDNFQSFFGTKVKLDAKKRSGKIVIQYSSNEDLERILELIK